MPDGRVCFVHGTLPGERVAIRILKAKKSYVEAELSRIIEASPHRVRPLCPIFGRCGGCAYQHANYEFQLILKAGQVSEILRRIGGFSHAEVRPMLPSPQQWEYRNRLSVHIENGRVGFYHRNSRKLIEAAHCPIGSRQTNAQLAKLSLSAPYERGRITLRENSDQYGFTQVNNGAAQILLEIVRGMLGRGGSLLIDAYCGSGFFAKGAKDLFKAVTGIEWSERSILRALQDAEASETYLKGAVEEHLRSVLRDADKETTALILDPPAEGISQDVVFAILEERPANIIYVSCHPATLARDLKKLSSTYRLDHAQPLDMFPQTAEIEVVAKLQIHNQTDK